jgi:hypothetical protein
MTANAKPPRDRSRDKLVGTQISADLDSRRRSTYDRTPRDTANGRRHRAAQREVGPLRESALLTVDQICAELHISRSTFCDTCPERSPSYRGKRHSLCGKTSGQGGHACTGATARPSSAATAVRIKGRRPG